MDRSLFPLVEATCSQICLPCPRCGAGLPCLDVSFIDICDKRYRAAGSNRPAPPNLSSTMPNLRMRHCL